MSKDFFECRMNCLKTSPAPRELSETNWGDLAWVKFQGAFGNYERFS
jgi:hypothetical protein